MKNIQKKNNQQDICVGGRQIMEESSVDWKMYAQMLINYVKKWKGTLK